MLGGRQLTRQAPQRKLKASGTVYWTLSERKRTRVPKISVDAGALHLPPVYPSTPGALGDPTTKKQLFVPVP